MTRLRMTLADFLHRQEQAARRGFRIGWFVGALGVTLGYLIGGAL